MEFDFKGEIVLVTGAGKGVYVANIEEIRKVKVLAPIHLLSWSTMQELGLPSHSLT